METYYTVYKVTNKISGKFYIGTHKTTNLDDDYYGSGKYLKRSIEKHGIENFEKEILHIFNNAEDMFAKEAEIVNEDFLAEENTYNLRVGGFGGWDYVNSTLSKEHRVRVARIAGKASAKSQDHSKRLKKSHEALSKLLKDDPDYLKKKFKNKKHRKYQTSETKFKISRSMKGKNTGTKNSQYGTCWITNGKENKKIYRDQFIPDGWRLGRNI